MKLICVALISALFATTSCATSASKDAKVNLVDGKLCFATDAQTTITVDRINVIHITGQATNWKASPKFMWILGAQGESKPVEILANECVEYGKLKSGMIVLRDAETLLPQTTYSVFIAGKPSSTTQNIIGYRATFCLIPAPDGKMIAAATVYDRSENKWLDSRCTAIPPK